MSLKSARSEVAVVALAGRTRTAAPRPFIRGDVGRAVRFFGECSKISSLRGYMHPGDFLHFLNNGLRGRDPAPHVFVVDSPLTPEGLAAVVTVFPGARVAAFDVSVHPGFKSTELERRLVMWAEKQIRGSMGTDRAAFDAASHDGSLIQDSKPPEAMEAFEVDCVDCDYAKRDVLSDLGYVTAAEPHMYYTTRSLAESIPEPVLPPALFEPVGCHKDYRRLGLARALLHEGMRRLKSKGISVAVVEPLAPKENQAAYALYESVGFRPYCGWIKYRKEFAACGQ